jgi:sortase A
VKLLARIFAVVGLLALGYCAFELARARLFQARESSRFAPPPHPEPTAPGPRTPAPDAPVTPRPAAGSPMAVLAIPRLGLSTVVVEGAGDRELKLGPGHIPGTSLPGDGGNFAVAGHRDSFFRPLRLIRLNDSIVVTTHQREYRYNVVSTRVVRPRDVYVLSPVGHEVLTLVTCYPFDFIGAAPRRFIVQADCVNCESSPATEGSQ